MGHVTTMLTSQLLPSGYLLHSHGKSPSSIGKPSICMGHRKTMAMLVITNSTVGLPMYSTPDSFGRSNTKPNQPFGYANLPTI